MGVLGCFTYLARDGECAAAPCERDDRWPLDCEGAAWRGDGGAGVPLEQRPILVGLLIKYETWEKIAEILYNGEILRIAAREVEKAGRKDLQREQA